MKIKPNLIGFSGEEGSMLSLVLINNYQSQLSLKVILRKVKEINKIDLFLNLKTC